MNTQLVVFDPVFCWQQIARENARKKRLKLSRGIRPYYARPNHKARKQEMETSITPQMGCWLRYQLDLRNMTLEPVAQKAEVSQCMVSHFLKARRNSKKVKKAFAEVLGFPNFEAVIAASRGKEEM